MKSLKYFQGDLLQFSQVINERKIKKEDVLHVNTILNNGQIIVIAFYYEG